MIFSHFYDSRMPHICTIARPPAGSVSLAPCHSYVAISPASRRHACHTAKHMNALHLAIGWYQRSYPGPRGVSRTTHFSYSAWNALSASDNET